MSIQYQVATGTVVLCNYDTGFMPPEMVGRRPAVVISPRLPHRDDLCCVVPLSQTKPAVLQAFHVEIIVNLPPPWGGDPRWAKGDMVSTVALSRLDLFHTGRDQYGKRKFLQLKVKPEELKAIQAAVLHGLGLGALTGHL